MMKRRNSYFCLYTIIFLAEKIIICTDGSADFQSCADRRKTEIEIAISMSIIVRERKNSNVSIVEISFFYSLNFDLFITLSILKLKKKEIILYFYFPDKFSRLVCFQRIQKLIRMCEQDLNIFIVRNSIQSSVWQ